MRCEVLALSLLFTVACTAKTIGEQACAEGRAPLTYEGFGQPFLQKHCQTCHGALGADRNGAPLAYDFGTIQLVEAYRERMYVRAASVNTTMPPGPDDPTEEERDSLAQWLACDIP